MRSDLLSFFLTANDQVPAQPDKLQETAEQENTCINIEQSAEPLNEFEQNDHIFYS